MVEEETKKESPVIKAAFGAKNRDRLISMYFGERGGAEARAWEHVYRLLMWIDQTTGLAHCYESDKSQPGKNWYRRSLAFHDWLSASLGASPAALADEVDWLFRRATTELAHEVLHSAQRVAQAAQKQRQPYEGRGFPKPGEDPELISIIREVLGDHLSEDIPSQTWQDLVQRVRQYVTLENKRRNLVGEGFEDVLAAVIRKHPAAAALDVRTRTLLHELPGFQRHKQGEKPNKVDLAVIRPNAMRTIVTAKWSVRADREKQFVSEHHEYVMAESDRQPFQYVFLTNEFDPARLMRACEQLSGNAWLFSHVVHINPDALRATYGDSPGEDSMKKVLGYADKERLIGLDRWIELLTQP